MNCKFPGVREEKTPANKFVVEGVQKTQTSTGIQRYRDTGIQGYRNAGIQGYRETGRKGYRIPGYRDTGIQGKGIQ